MSKLRINIVVACVLTGGCALRRTCARRGRGCSARGARRVAAIDDCLSLKDGVDVFPTLAWGVWRTGRGRSLRSRRPWRPVLHRGPAAAPTGWRGVTLIVNAHEVVLVVHAHTATIGHVLHDVKIRRDVKAIGWHV